MERKKIVIINSLYYGILVIFFLICFLFLYKYCLLVLLSYLTSLVFQPFVNKIIHFFHITNRIVEIIVSVLLILLIYVFFLFFIALVIYSLLHVFHFLPDYLTKVYQMVLHNHYLITISQELYEHLKTLIETIFSKMLHFIFQIVMHITTIIGYLFFHFILTVLFVFDNSLESFMSRHFSFPFEIVISSIKQTFFMLLKTYSLLFLVTFLGLYSGFLFIQLQHPFMIAFLIALFDFFPVLGIDMIMIPWIILCTIFDQMTLAISLLIIYLIITIIRNVLEPHLMSKQVKIPALYFFITMIIMSKIMGFLGMILTPFLLIIISQIKENQILKNHLKKVDIRI